MPKANITYKAVGDDEKAEWGIMTISCNVGKV